MQNLLAKCWFYMINMSGTGINIFYFVLYVLCNRSIFFFFYIFSPMKGRCWLRNKMVSWFINQWICKRFCMWVFLEFSWEVDVNWLYVAITSYVKVNFKEIIILIIIMIIIIIIMIIIIIIIILIMSSV